MKLLPEYRQSSSSKVERESDGLPFQRVEEFRKGSQTSSGDQSYGRHGARNSPDHQGEIQECVDPSFEKALRGKRILLVEDDELPRKVASHALRRLGAIVEQCQNGKQAVTLVDDCLAKAIPYDYILMDCEMPVFDGFEATRQIRKVEKA